MADIKLIATDLDGTFLSSFTEAHPENIVAMKECQKRGIHVCACTGRMWAGAKNIVTKSGFDRYCVTNNGASIIDITTGEHRFRSRIDPQYLKAILQYGIDANASVSVAGYDTLYAYGPTSPDIYDRIKFMQGNPSGDTSKVEIFDDLDEMVEICAPYAEKIGVRMNFIDNLDKVYDHLSEITEVEITSSWPGNMEITSKGGTKAEALSVLADIYEVDAENVMTFGDNFNDISMIMWAGIGVAMGNADDRLKNIANFVTARNYEGGVAKAIYEMVLA